MKDVGVLRNIQDSQNAKMIEMHERGIKKDQLIVRLTMQVEALKAIISREVNLYDWLQDD